MDECVPCARHCTKYRVSAANSVPVAVSILLRTRLEENVIMSSWDHGYRFLRGIQESVPFFPRHFGFYTENIGINAVSPHRQGGSKEGENALEAPDSCATMTFWEPNCTPSQSLKLGERMPSFPLALKAGLRPAEKAL